MDNNLRLATDEAPTGEVDPLVALVSAVADLRQIETLVGSEDFAVTRVASLQSLGTAKNRSFKIKREEIENHDGEAANLFRVVPPQPPSKK